MSCPPHRACKDYLNSKEFDKSHVFPRQDLSSSIELRAFCQVSKDYLALKSYKNNSTNSKEFPKNNVFSSLYRLFQVNVGGMVASLKWRAYRSSTELVNLTGIAKLSWGLMCWNEFIVDKKKGHRSIPLRNYRVVLAKTYKFLVRPHSCDICLWQTL